MNPQLSTRHVPPSVRLHIERLVVDEPLLAVGHGVTLQAAIETELTRLLAEGGLVPHADSDIASLTTHDIQVAHREHPVPLAKQIAQAVHATIGVGHPPAIDGRPNGETRQ